MVSQDVKETVRRDRQMNTLAIIGLSLAFGAGFLTNGLINYDVAPDTSADVEELALSSTLGTRSQPQFGTGLEVPEGPHLSTAADRIMDAQEDMFIPPWPTTTDQAPGCD